MMYLPVELVDLDRSKGFVSVGSASGFDLKNRWLRESRRERERERKDYNFELFGDEFGDALLEGGRSVTDTGKA